MVGEFATAHYGDELTVYTDGSLNLRSLQTGSETLLGAPNPRRWQFAGSLDFDGDGLLEIVFVNKPTGNVYIADDLSGGITEEKLLGSTCVGLMGEGYSLLGAGNFDGKSGENDILLLSPVFGDASVSLNYGLPIWAFDGGVKEYDGWLGALVNTWQTGGPLKGDISDLADVNARNYRYDIVGIGDFNGDGRDDLMLQNMMPSNVGGTDIMGAGDIYVFLTGDENAVKTGAAPTVSYAGKVDAFDVNGWTIAGTGDFNNDHIDDVLLLNQVDGGLACWIMDYGQMQYSTWIGIKPDGMDIAGIWDVDVDGTDDVILSDGAGGYTAWTIKNGAYSGLQLLA